MDLSQTPYPPNSKAAKLAMLSLAAFMLLCGLCACAFYIIVPLADRSGTRLETSTVFGATAGFGFFLAAILTWQGSKPSPTARNLPPALALALAFIGAVFLGSVTLTFQSVAALTFPPFHFLAAILIPLTFIAYAARRLGRTSGLRALVAFFSWGALGATFLALMAEVLMAGLVILVAAIALSATPDGRALLNQLSASLRFAQNGTFPELPAQLLNNSIVANGILIYFAVIIPPIEEALKTVALALMNRERTRLADAVLWGIGAGAGFGALENLFNATAFLSAWAFGMMLRVGATTMHVANGALMGQGWYAARIEKKWRRLGLAYGASVFFHMLWNGTVIFLSQRAASFELNSGAGLEKMLAQGVFVFALGGVIVILSGLGIVWIIYAVRHAQQDLTTN